MQKVTYSQLQTELEKYDYFVIDGKLEPLYPELAALGDKKTIFWLDDPESSKSIDVWNEAIEFFLNAKIHRKAKLVAVGGGATTDFAGFVAATILRGIEWLAVPTTLLAMIDASIGGKTGLNSPQGKNLIGAFHMPSDIFLCDDFLKTLGAKELQSGKGELLKYFYLSEEVANSWQGQLTNSILEKCANYKQSVVDRDKFENGERVLLNLGHTFGHAIEKCLGLPHGVSVSHGLKMMIQIYQPDLIESFKNYAQDLELNLQTELKLNPDDFFQYVLRDKKRIDDEHLTIIIPQKIGVSEIRLVTFKELEEKLSHAKSYFSPSS